MARHRRFLPSFPFLPLPQLLLSRRIPLLLRHPRHDLRRCHRRSQIDGGGRVGDRGRPAVGFPHAQSALGFLYATGCTKEPSASKAFLYHHFSAEGGNKQSKMALAYTYFRQEAKEYFEKAAENDEPGGHYNSGVLYLKGIGVKRDVKTACKYFIMAANAGQPKAFFQLGKMFQTGIALRKNLAMTKGNCEEMRIACLDGAVGIHEDSSIFWSWILDHK